MRLSAEGLVLLTNDSARAHFGASAIVGETLQWLSWSSVHNRLTRTERRPP